MSKSNGRGQAVSLNSETTKIAVKIDVDPGEGGGGGGDHPGEGDGSGYGDGGFSSFDSGLLATDQKAIGSSSTDCNNHMSSPIITLDRGRLVAQWRMQIPKDPIITALPDSEFGTGGEGNGFVIFAYGNRNLAGSVIVKYMPKSGRCESPHTIVAYVVGASDNRMVSADITHTGTLIPIYVEYSGSELNLIADRSSDEFIGSASVPLPSAAKLTFGADFPGLYFDNLDIYDQKLVDIMPQEDMAFPYFYWNKSESHVNNGVIAVLPTPTLPTPTQKYFSFVDYGFRAGEVPASFNLRAAGAVAEPSIFINEVEVPLPFPGGSCAEFLDWIAFQPVNVWLDGKLVHLKIKSGAETLKVSHTEGDLSLSVRFQGCLGADWGKTRAALGRIPPPALYPHTGEPNSGISVLGATKQFAFPKGLKVSLKDDGVRTAGKMIGSTQNRPAATPALARLAPKNFLGSSRAPLPKNSLLFGSADGISNVLDPDKVFQYGVVWERFVPPVDPSNVGGKIVTMNSYPYHRSRQGDHIAGMSFDIPFGHVLRGININFVGAMPGYTGNKGVSRFEWGEGNLKFPIMLSGSQDYSCLFNLLVARDPLGKTWTQIPSLGTDAVKVAGANTWKEIIFKPIDFQTLVDVDGYPLLEGQRRTHFKLVLANELSAITYTGLSYVVANGTKK